MTGNILDPGSVANRVTPLRPEEEHPPIPMGPLVNLVNEVITQMDSKNEQERISSKVSSLMRPFTGPAIVSRMYFQLALQDRSSLRARFVTDVLREVNELRMAKLLVPLARAAAHEPFRKKRLDKLLSADPKNSALGSRVRVDVRLSAQGTIAVTSDSGHRGEYSQASMGSNDEAFLKSLLEILSETGSGVLRDVVIVHAHVGGNEEVLDQIIDLSRILPIVVAVVYESQEQINEQSVRTNRDSHFDPTTMFFLQNASGPLTLIDVDNRGLMDVMRPGTLEVRSHNEVAGLAIAYSALSLFRDSALKKEAPAIAEALRREAPGALPLSSEYAAFHRLMHFTHMGIDGVSARQKLCGVLLDEGYFAEAIRLLNSIPPARRNGYYDVRRLRAAFATADFETAAEGVSGEKISVRDERIRVESIAALKMLEELASDTKVGREFVSSVPGKVLTILHAAPPHQSGGYVVRAHSLLKSILKSELDVVAYVRPGFPDSDNSLAPGKIARSSFEQVPYFLIGSRTRRKSAEYAYMIESIEYYKDAIRRERPKVVHLRSTYVSALPGLIAARHFGLPVVYEVSGLWELVYESSSTARHEGKRARTVRLENAVLAHADRVVTLTESMARIIESRVQTRASIEIVPNAVNSEAFAPREEFGSVRAGSPWPPGVPIVGYVGSFVDYEGLDLLIRAFASLKQKGVEFRAIMIGDGVKLNEIRDLSDELGLEDRVKFTGRIAHADVAKYYSVIDVCAYPRRLTPATAAVSPMKPFEAMASGKAVLVSDVPALVEIAGGGERALVFKQGSVASLVDALLAVLQEPDRMEQLRRRGQQWVREERDWSVVGGKFVATLASLAEKSTGNRASGEMSS